MSLPLTPEMLSAAYDFLRTLPPFRRWKLPPSDDIAFHVGRHAGEYGSYSRTIGKADHTITISERLISQVSTLLFFMAHEMVHLYQDINKCETGQSVHNADFHKRARAICKTHGWDYKLFA